VNPDLYKKDYHLINYIQKKNVELLNVCSFTNSTFFILAFNKIQENRYEI